MIASSGIVIKVIDYQDNAKIIYLFTKEGLKSLIVKGAAKVSSHTFNFAKELVRLDYETDPKEKYLIGGKVINYYKNIQENYDYLKSSYLILELVYALSNNINDYEIAYSFLIDVLDAIDNGYNYEIIELTFRTKFLYLLGLAPNFNSCVNCGSKDDLRYFSLFDGGMKCTKCSDLADYKLSTETTNLFRILYLVKFDSILSKIADINYDYEEMNKTLEMFYAHFLGFNSKVSSVYRKMDKK